MTTVQDRPVDGFAAARRAMIDCQLRVSGVNDEYVLTAINKVGRENHLPESAWPLAYIDRAVALGDGQFLAAPLFYGQMLTEAAPKAEDKVLIVEGGSGYLPALVRTIAVSVDVIDAAEATQGTAGSGDYTLLLIDGAIEELPDSLSGRLADNGRLVTGIVDRGVTRLTVGRKAAGEVALLTIAEMGIPVLSQFARPKGWSF